jgi:hypothetical protein
MAELRTLKFIAIAVLTVAAVFAIINSTGLLRQATTPKPLDVKFIDYNIIPPGLSTMKQGQQITIAFNIINNEPNSVSNVSVKTDYNGGFRVFSIDKPSIIISNPIGPKGGRSGMQTLTITSLQNDQQALESNVTMSLYVGSSVTDIKNFKLRVEK